MVAADVYAHPMHVGRGGWTWYTGSAGWMYQAALRALLGLQRRGTVLSVSPCIPRVWPEYTLTWRVDDATTYRFLIVNPDHRSHGIASATCDGVAVDARAIPLFADGGVHDVQIVIGDDGAGDNGGARARLSVLSSDRVS